MKKTVLIIPFLILSCLSSFGQKIRFCDSSNQWAISYQGATPDPWIYYMGAFYAGDTLSDSIFYKKMRPGYYYSGMTYTDYIYVREDSMEGKIFIKYLLSDTIERVLYDYNLQVSDTFTFLSNKHYIESIDSTLINANWHRTWKMRNLIPGGYRDYVVIEGIGSTGGPLFPVEPFFGETTTMLYCFGNNGNNPSVIPEVDGFFDNVTSCTSDTKLVATKRNSVIIAPNPSNETTKIHLPQSIKSGSVNIINCLGQTVFNEHFQNAETITIGDKIRTPGIYLYHITDYLNGTEYSGKFTKD